MTLAARLHDLADAMERHTAKGEPLLPEDVRAIVEALRGEADAITGRQRDRALRLWEMKRAA